MREINSAASREDEFIQKYQPPGYEVRNEVQEILETLSQNTDYTRNQLGSMSGCEFCEFLENECGIFIDRNFHIEDYIREAHNQVLAKFS